MPLAPLSWDGSLPWLNLVHRIQINGTVSADALRAVVGRYSCPIITQHNAANEHLVLFPGGMYHHALLVDASGGRGALPAEWTRPVTLKAVGFAGG